MYVCMYVYIYIGLNPLSIVELDHRSPLTPRSLTSEDWGP